MNREERRKTSKDIQVNLKNSKLVGRRIPGVTVGSPGAHQVLGEQVSDVIRQVEAKAVEPTPRQVGHVPVIAPCSTPIVGWATFCLRCTDTAGEFVTVCEVDDSDWPPVFLTAADLSPSEV